MYSMDKEWYVPTNIEIYKTDLAASNSQKKFVMNSWLNYGDYFGMQDLSPSSHAKLSRDVLEDQTAAKKFVQFTNKKDIDMKSVT